jgi:sterol desaturase/sphingolipid hydroxylase (fatty acid hydroxylase superfamily)
METVLQKLLAVDQNMVMVILITFFYTLEQLIKTPHQFNKRGFHLLNNIPFQIMFMVIFYFVASFQVWSIQKLNDYHVGLFYYIQMPYVLKVIIGVTCFDLISYFTHRLSHKTPVIWRLHRVHHSDTTMDSSTYFRGHPLELTFAAANIAAAAIFGLEVTTLTIYFLVLLPFVISQHSNFQSPVWMDTTIGKIFTTPNMHKIHHHQDQEYTDSNFADIFILWDRLFGTYKHTPVKQISYGLQEFNDNKKQTFWYLLKSPFLNIKRIRKQENDKPNVNITRNNVIKSDSIQPMYNGE